MSQPRFGLLGVLLFGIATAASGQIAGSAGPAERAVLSVEEDFRVAQLRNDTSTLNRILAASFYETNQNGNSRDKAATIALWTSFRIRSRTIERSEVRFTGNTAVVTGAESEENASGVDRMLFMRLTQGWAVDGCSRELCTFVIPTNVFGSGQLNWGRAPVTTGSRAGGRADLASPRRGSPRTAQI